MAKNKKRKKPVYEYKIGVPVSEYWVYDVKATSIAEAMTKIRNCENSIQQVYSLPAPVGRRVPKVFSKKLTKP